MSITYVVPEFSDSAKTVEVTYTNSDGNIHKRILTIPRNSDGSLNEDYWAEIQEGQLLGLEKKIEVGAVTFMPPSEAVDYDNATPEPEEPAPADPAPSDLE